jgi:hypothetical protein
MIRLLEKDYLYLSICQTIKKPCTHILSSFLYIVYIDIRHVQVENVLLMLLYKKNVHVVLSRSRKKKCKREKEKGGT